MVPMSYRPVPPPVCLPGRRLGATIPRGMPLADLAIFGKSKQVKAGKNILRG
jgi:hypothetical protein